jgi:carbonic anhydrase
MHAIVDGHHAAALPCVRRLLQDYAAWLNVDLSFQNFATELATLPGPYAPPRGALLLASVDGAAAGCIALRPLTPAIGEVKRLWVAESCRGLGLGGLLVGAITERARALCYERLRLDSLPHMHSALALYRRSGFSDIPAYYDSPLSGTVYLEKVIGQPFGVSSP